MAAKKRQPPKKKRKVSTDPADQPIPPYSYTLKQVMEGVVSDGVFTMAFHARDVVVEKGFLKADGREIPRLRTITKGKVSLDIIGSHLETDLDRQQTHIVFNPDGARLIFMLEPGQPCHTAVFFIQHCVRRWSVASDSRTRLRGDAAVKTVFQGVQDDPDLHTVLDALEEIKRFKGVDHLMETEFPSGTTSRRFLGTNLLKVLIPAVRNSDYKKVRLIEKCMKFLEDPSPTKADRIRRPLLLACDELDRIPTARELYTRLVSGGCPNLSESRFYSDLPHVGLGWLTKKKPSK